jgi:uncharacterized protein (TIGR02266 family)
MAGDRDRRRHRRVTTRAKCWIERDSVTLFGRVLDIGVGGLFLRTAFSLDAGTPVDVYVAPEGSPDRIRARGTVAWSGLRTDGPRPASGIGVSFESVVDGSAALERLLDSSPEA